MNDPIALEYWKQGRVWRAIARETMLVASSLVLISFVTILIAGSTLTISAWAGYQTLVWCLEQRHAP